MSNTTLYEQDFYAWANQQAALLRAGRLTEADIANIAEEIESMGRAEKRELVSRLGVLLTHLLKWQYQPGHRGTPWEGTIATQRRALLRHLADNPSLKHKLREAVDDGYLDARDMGAAETGLAEQTFPRHCPWSFEQIMAPDFWPD
jgi:hypothetical protein